MTDREFQYRLPTLEQLFDAAVEHNMPCNNYYYDWNVVANWQFKALLDFGMTPESNVLDVGCGAFRLGNILMQYQTTGKYAGIDAIESFLDVGYTLLNKMKISPGSMQSVANGVFDLSGINGTFDIAISQSVLNHLSRPLIEKCLISVKSRMKSGGIYIITCNEIGHSPPAGVYYDNKIPMELPLFRTHESVELFNDIADKLNIKFEKLKYKHVTGQYVGAFYF